jgi:esterase
MPEMQDLHATARSLELGVPVTPQSDQAVMFIHGWSCRASDWQPALDALDGRWPSLVPDLPGHGKSRQVSWEDWTIVGLAQLLCALAENHWCSRLALVGHSMGGTIALETARLWAERHGGDALGGVILVDTFALPYGDMDADTIAGIEAPFRKDFVAAMHDLVNNTTATGLAEETRARLRARMAEADPEQMLPLWADLLRWSPDRAFAALDCPIRAINGEHIPEPARKRCAPHVQARVIPGAHHFPQFETPEAFAAFLRDELEQITR